MKYILIANNTNLVNSKKDFNFDFEVNDEDLIILFGKQLPLEWEKIKKHKNKILFMRVNKLNVDLYQEKTLIRTAKINHRQKLEQNHSLYKKIIIYPKNNIEKYLDKLIGFDFNKLLDIENSIVNLNEVKAILPGKIPSTGFVAFLYVKYNLINDNDKIIMIGFDGNNVADCHDIPYEQSIYKNEKNKNNKFIFI